jgi:1,2-dihydroxy-3-keto-5-methylthiopentene dioxygenase
MSHLTIYEDSKADNPTLDSRDYAVIADALSTIGVQFERWETHDPLQTGATDEDVMEAYASDIERLKSENGYQSVDVVRLWAEHPERDEFRQKFLSEHVHSDDEVRFFVEGAGMFYLHADGKVFMMLCEAGDLINVPSGAKHWFDMGPEPSFTCIRLFTRPDGWHADFTGDNIAERFPKFERPAA